MASPWVVTGVTAVAPLLGEHAFYRREQNALIDALSAYGLLMVVVATVAISRAPAERRKETRSFFLGLAAWTLIVLHTVAAAVSGHLPAFSTIEYGFLALAVSLVGHDVGKYMQMLETSEAETAEARSQQRAQAQLYRDMVAVVGDGIVLLDQEHRVRLWNRGMTALTGIEETAASNRSIWELLKPGDEIRLRLEANLRAGAGGAPIEMRLGAAPRQPLVELRSVALELEGQPAFVLVADDVTQRKELKARMMEADRLEPWAPWRPGSANEINNPLSYVILNLEELESQPPSSSEGTELLGAALLGAHRIRDIVRAVGVFSRSEEELRPVLLSEVAASAVAMVQNEIKQRAKLSVVRRCSPVVRGNETKLAQVVLNLLVNATHAIPAGAPEDNVIEVMISQQGSTAVCEVRDTGAGIPEAIRDRIFDQFFTTKSVGTGTGLGLTICRETVRSLGGDLEVESTVGKGTTFRMTLPISEAITRPMRLKSPSVLPPPKRLVVLLVDDEPALLRSLRRPLSRHFDVTVCDSALQALEHIDAGMPVDVIVTDVMMPGVTGIELFELVKKRSQTLADHMVFTTGGAFTPEAREFCELMADRVCLKPVDVRDLGRLITLTADVGGEAPARVSSEA